MNEELWAIPVALVISGLIAFAFAAYFKWKDDD